MMRTRPKNKSLLLLCSSCDAHYARVFSDRLVVYSNHEGEQHTSAFALEDLEQVYAVAATGRYLKLPCSCNQLPCAEIQFERLTIRTKHKARTWQPHSNVLTLDEIADICRMLGKVDDILTDELDAPGRSVA